MDDELPTHEQARVRRRDRDMTADERAPMNNASNKWFAQVLAAQGVAAMGRLKKRRKRKKSKKP